MPLLVSSVTVPGADTPSFYLVSSSLNESANLLPLRMPGGSSRYATLTGSGAIGQYYVYQGRLVASDPADTSSTYQPIIVASPTVTGCTTYGILRFLQGGGYSFGCPEFDSPRFQLEPNNETSPLGAKLVFGFSGEFYACGISQDIWYKERLEDGPPDCSAIDLYTVPVV
ncbi:GPI-anchored small secreted protein [Phlegmacium glaucopus]|nr:GPI-anchored small secreted protein [Phlegmacium glaucopus]